MLQHLWTGHISNAAVDVVQGSKSMEIRSVGVSKGAAIERILGENDEDASVEEGSFPGFQGMNITKEQVAE